MGDSALLREAIAKRSRALTQLNGNPGPVGAIQVRNEMFAGSLVDRGERSNGYTTARRGDL